MNEILPDRWTLVVELGLRSHLPRFPKFLQSMIGGLAIQLPQQTGGEDAEAPTLSVALIA